VSCLELIAAEKAHHPVDLLCELLGVSRSGFYAWQSRPPSDRALSDAWLLERIREIHAANRGVYGAPRVHAELRLGHEILVGRKRVERLMREAGLSGLVPKRRGRTTIRVPGVRVADDLVDRDFRPAAPNLLWVADITYLSSGRAGSISRPSRTPTRVGLSAGRWPITCAPSSSSTRWRWPLRAGARRPG
jgi:putative transposase